MKTKIKYLPSLEKIAEETARIREGWSEAEEEHRLHGCTGTRGGRYKMEPWRVPVYSISLSPINGLVADRID